MTTTENFWWLMEKLQHCWHQWNSKLNFRAEQCDWRNRCSITSGLDPVRWFLSGVRRTEPCPSESHGKTETETNRYSKMLSWFSLMRGCVDLITKNNLRLVITENNLYNLRPPSNHSTISLLLPSRDIECSGLSSNHNVTEEYRVNSSSLKQTYKNSIRQLSWTYPELNFVLLTFFKEQLVSNDRSYLTKELC